MAGVALAGDRHELGPDRVFGPWLTELWPSILALVPPELEPLEETALLRPACNVFTDSLLVEVPPPRNCLFLPLCHRTND